MRLPFPTILVCAVLGVPAAAAAQGDPPAPETAPAAVSEAVSGADETIPVIVDLVDLGVPSDAPAIANAVFHAIGRRIRSSNTTGSRPRACWPSSISWRRT